MNKRIQLELKEFGIIISVIIVVAIILVSFINVFVVDKASKHLSEVESVTDLYAQNNIIVTDSGIWSKKQKEVMLEDRISMAATLYHNNTNNTTLYLLITDSENEENNTSLLTDSANENHIPISNIVVESNSDTFISGYRNLVADNSLTSAVIVAQRIPLYRQLYDASVSGIDIYGIKSDLSEIPRSRDVWNNFIEFFVRAHDSLALFFDWLFSL